MLVGIRSKVKDARVFWVEPNIESKPHIVDLIRKIAQENSDTVLPTTRWQKDKIHPSWEGYKALAERTK
jgi:hypothetical protein